VAAKTKNRKGKPTVVGIGASAGGIEALKVLFTALPADLGHAYVVIMHLAPDHHSELCAIIARTTAMPVSEVRDGKRQPLKRNHVYVISPGHQLELTDSTIVAKEFAEPRGRRTTIDTFFQSLARKHDDVFAIVLSGGGNDGLVGATAFKEPGGFILVQEAQEAALPDIPLAVIWGGLAVIVRPVGQLAVRINESTQTINDLPDAE
jgi:two-component system CheB/CheR fusion protein